jgi:thiol-disulfide isomerase/thioredoxin
MTYATLLVALIATTAAETSGDPVLLDFQASWCGPCNQMRPEIDKLIAKGYPVKAVDIDRSPELSERYRVSAVPTFVIVDPRGKELARTQGAIPAAQLAAFYNQTKLKAASNSNAPPVEEVEERPHVEETEGAESSATTPLINPRPWETVVRIKMHLSSSEWGYGSGTIISSTPEESIILTCAHIFRVKSAQQPSPKNFRVPITVDLFNGQLIGRNPAQVARAEQDVVGEAIDYDFDNDVGLIRIRPGRKLPASRVVPAWWTPKKGMKMYTVGCSHGADATAWDTTILEPKINMTNTATRKGFSEIKCANQPKEGRSGGGLYTTDGYVAGVCDFADPNEHAGLYAVPEAIHRLLDRNQLAMLYKAPTANDALLASTRSPAKPAGGTKYRAQNAEESTARTTVTLPPPEQVGIRTWSRPKATDKPSSTPRPRSTEQPDTAIADNREARVRPGEARQVDATLDPGPDARALERLNAEDLPAEAATAPVPAPRRVAKADPTGSKPKSSGWRGVRDRLPDLDAPRQTSP